MTYLPSLGDDAKLFDVMRAFPESARPLLQLHDVLLRGPSPLTVAERELLAAYVSGLNACGYCHGIHAEVAAAFGIAEGRLVALIDDVEAVDVDQRMRALLLYVGKLTRSPDRMTPADAETVLDAGWSERALHDAVAVCALFNFMNRYVEGLGIASTPEYTSTSADRLADIGYAGLLQLLEEA